MGGEVPVSFNINPSSPPSFPGQSQGVSQPLEVVTSVQKSELAEAAEDFPLIVEDSSKEAIEDAIASPTWKEKIKAYTELLAEAFDFGVEAVKELLKPWESHERWGAFLELEMISPQKMQQLVAIAPNCFEWCDA